MFARAVLASVVVFPVCGFRVNKRKVPTEEMNSHDASVALPDAKPDIEKAAIEESQSAERSCPNFGGYYRVKDESTGETEAEVATITRPNPGRGLLTCNGEIDLGRLRRGISTQYLYDYIFEGDTQLMIEGNWGLKPFELRGSASNYSFKLEGPGDNASLAFQKVAELPARPR